MTHKKQRLAILGSTGSIGTQTLDIVRRYGDLFEVTTLTARSRWEALVAQAIEFSPDNVVIADETYYPAVRDALADRPVKVYAGNDALEQVVRSEQVDTVVMALVGYSGLFPTASALRCGKKVALANKECLVCAGELVMAEAERCGAEIVPVDSEHSAIFQCLSGERSEVEKVILTASGGPFLNRSADELRHVTVAEALAHPSWCMGAKVTIDSASLMNKGFEVIEARWLFGVDAGRIDVVIHPGSVVHSMVQFRDGAVKAQIGTPDMHLPIQYALTYPQRLPLEGRRLDFCELGTLEPSRYRPLPEPGARLRMPAPGRLRGRGAQRGQRGRRSGLFGRKDPLHGHRPHQRADALENASRTVLDARTVPRNGRCGTRDGALADLTNEKTKHRWIS